MLRSVLALALSALPAGVALAQPVSEVEADYGRLCAACHGRAAQGAPGLAPPLSDVPVLARTTQGRAYLADVMNFGVAGPIKVGGKLHSGMMARPGGTPEERLGILNHLLRKGTGEAPAPFRAADLLVAPARPGAPQAVARRRPPTAP